MFVGLINCHYSSECYFAWGAEKLGQKVLNNHKDVGKCLKQYTK